MTSPRCVQCGDKIKPLEDTDMVEIDGHTLHVYCADELAQEGFAFASPAALPAGPVQPVTHGPRGKRSKAERNARKAARRVRARAKR
jgi:hypothetical protein